MLTGWFTLHRDWLASEYWIETPFDRAHALMDLVGHARFKPGHVRLRGQRIDLERGQVAWSQKQLAIRWGWSVNKVRRFLSELVRDGIVHVEGNRTTTIITLLNYDESFDKANAGRANTPSLAAVKTNSPTEASADEQARHGRQTKEPCQPRQHRQPPKETEVVTEDLPEKDSEKDSGKDSEKGPAKDADNSDWLSLAKSLRSLGVTGADQVIATVRQRGLPWAEVQQLLEEFRQGVPEKGPPAWGPPAWGPGALVARLTGRLTCWPTPSKEHRRHQDRKGQRRRDMKRHSDKAERMQRLDFERAEQAELEQRLGPVLEGMTGANRQALEERAIQNEQERTLSRRSEALHRIRLLRHLADELRLAAA